MAKRNFGRYRSKLSISNYAGKLYEDPFYGIERPNSIVNYAVFSSKWDIEEINEDNILKIIHRDSGDSISISFANLRDRINFAKNIYASRRVKQIGRGMDLEPYANMNIKPGGDENAVDKYMKKILGNIKKARFAYFLFQ